MRIRLNEENLIIFSATEKNAQMPVQVPTIKVKLPTLDDF